MRLCDFKNLFGEPGRGLHSIRVFDIAVVDVLATLLVGYLVSFFWNLNFLLVCGLLFLLGIVLHRLLCVKTTVDKSLKHFSL
jgi:hypothetical protein